MRGWLALGLTLFACGDGGSQPPDVPATLELGTGSWRFEPLVDGQEVELVHGAQGGWHMWTSLRVTGATVDHPTVRLDMALADGSRPAQTTTVMLPFDPPDEHGQQKLIGYTGVINDPACWVDALVRVSVTVTTDDGTALVDERDVTLRGGQYPPPPCHDE